MLKLLQIRPGEVRPALLLVLLMLVPSAGGAISSPGIDALFFARVGVEYLPYMYMLLGVVTLAVSLVVTGLLGRLPKRVLYVSIPLMLGLIMLAARLLIAFDLPWVYPALWLAMYLMWTLQYLVIWGLASMVFDTRQAKRLFPLFAAGGILGTATGGLITRPLVGWVGSENLLFAWALAFFVQAILMRPLLARVRETPIRSRWERPSFIRDLRRGAEVVRRSKLLSWMSAGACLLGALLFSVIFPFSKAVTAQFESEDAIAGFLGIFQGATTVVALLVSLFLANRLFARVGFVGALLGYPLIYLVGFGTVALGPSLAALAGLRFMQMVWRLALFDPAFQAVLGLVPPDQREPARAFIDGVPKQAGVVLAGLILAFGNRLLQPTQLYLLSAVIAGGGLLVFRRARNAYREALGQALQAGHPQIFFSPEQPFGGFQRDAVAIAAAVNGVSDPDPAIRRVSAEILGNLEVPDAIPTLVSALQDPDPIVRAALLRSLGRAGAQEALLEIIAALDDPEPQVRLEAVQAARTLAHYRRGLLTLVERLLDDPAPEVRSCVAVILLAEGPHSGASGVLGEMLDTADSQIRISVLDSVARWGTVAGFELALGCLQDPQPSVRRAAVRSLAHSDPQRALPRLIQLLGDEDRSVREAVAAGLGGLGPPALAPALEALNDPRLVEGALVALQSLPARQELPRLYAFAQEQARSARYYLDLWNGASVLNAPSPASELFADALRFSARRAARQAIQAIGLLNDPAVTSLALENLENRDSGQRANAMEVLDSLGERELVGPLLRIWEDRQAPASTGPLSKWLERGLEDPDPWVRACAALAAGESEDPSLESQLQQRMRSDPDSLVRETAARSLNGGSAMETLPTLSTLERILFLRRVPLFADLTPAELRQVALVAGEFSFSRSELIARQGEEGDEMYVILEGEIEVSVDSPAGTRQLLARRGPGEVVGEMSIISREPRMASLIAASDLRILRIAQKEFEGILRERPQTGLAVMRVLIKRLKEAQGSDATP